MQVTPSFVWSSFYYPQISLPPTFELWIWCYKLGLRVYTVNTPTNQRGHLESLGLHATFCVAWYLIWWFASWKSMMFLALNILTDLSLPSLKTLSTNSHADISRQKKKQIKKAIKQVAREEVRVIDKLISHLFSAQPQKLSASRLLYSVQSQSRLIP